MQKIFKQWWNTFSAFFRRHRFVFGVAGISIVILGLCTVFLWNWLSGPRSIAAYLPADAIVFAEFDARLDGEAWGRYHTLSEQSGGKWPSVSRLVEGVNSLFNIDFMSDVYPWVSRRIGLTLLADRRSALFLEVKDEKMALDFFRRHRISGIEERLQEKEIEGVITYQYPASLPAVIFPLGDYIILASDEAAATTILRARSSNLSSSEAFSRATRGLPRRSFGFVYGKPAELFLLMQSAQTSDDPSVSVSESALELLIKSLVQNFSREVASVDILDDMISVRHHALFSEGLRSKNLLFSDSRAEKYRANSARYYSDETEFFVGGVNFKGTIDTINALTSPAQVDTLLHEWIPPYDKLKDSPIGEFSTGYDGGQWKTLSAANSLPLPQRSLLDSAHFTRQPKRGDDILYMRRDFGELSLGTHISKERLETLILLSPERP